MYTILRLVHLLYTNLILDDIKSDLLTGFVFVLHTVTVYNILRFVQLLYIILRFVHLLYTILRFVHLLYTILRLVHLLYTNLILDGIKSDLLAGSVFVLHTVTV